MADQAISQLIQSYHELNPDSIDELTEEPSPLEFMRFVARNRPFVIRRGARNWKACKLWNAEYLVTVMANQLVNVAITAKGNADSPFHSQDSTLPPICFVKPYEYDEPFPSVLQQIQNHELQKGTEESASEPIRYAQTQNDNLRNEYLDLFKDVPRDIPFARIGLRQEPDAVNFWLGNSLSTTALHKDNYENIYVQILGRKHFVLLPPLCAPCVNEKALPAATYTLNVPNDGSRAKFTKDKLAVVLDSPAASVPFATWDPDNPDQQATKWSKLARPMRVSLDEGDMLYLPAMWYHKVSQSCSSEWLCCAVNYWYDMEFTGSLYPMSAFVREVGLAMRDQHSSSSSHSTR